MCMNRSADHVKLLLTSEGITNQSITNALLELLGKPFHKSRAVHVPTAANGEPGDKSWVETQINGLRGLGFLSVDVVDISNKPKDGWLPAFQRADLISFGGGSTKYLLEWLGKSGVTKELPGLLKTRVYMGISAGSMVAAKTISLTHENLFYYDKTHHLGETKGLGFIDFEIRPHLNDPYFTKVRLEYLEKLAVENSTQFYAIDDNTAIKVVDCEVTVVSEGNWKRFY